MIPSTVERVPQQTASHINDWIRWQTEANIERISSAGRPAIEARLNELDEEWDIERTLEMNAATVVLIGSALGLSVNKRFFALPAIVAGFLLQHAIQGWCPPLPIFRRLGFRTSSEIGYERYALKALRGDFHDVSNRKDEVGNVARVFDVVQS